MSYIKPVSEEAVLNLMYRTLPPKTDKSLENFNGVRRVFVSRGEGYMNKVTHKLTDPPMWLIRYMKNLGSKENPKVATDVIAFKIPGGDIIANFIETGNSLKGIFLEIYREGFVPYKKLCDNLADVRQDEYFLDTVSALTGKDFRKRLRNKR